MSQVSAFLRRSAVFPKSSLALFGETTDWSKWDNMQIERFVMTCFKANERATSKALRPILVESSRSLTSQWPYVSILTIPEYVSGLCPAWIKSGTPTSFRTVISIPQEYLTSLSITTVTLEVGCSRRAVPSVKYIDGGRFRHHFVNATTQGAQVVVLIITESASPTRLSCRKASTSFSKPFVSGYKTQPFHKSCACGADKAVDSVRKIW